ncbi:MAG: hypothetical protein ABIJ47_10700 [Candidatus Bathyarchaeota archaeon]
MGKGKSVFRLLLEASAVAPRYVRVGLGLLLLYLVILVGITTTR